MNIEFVGRNFTVGDKIRDFAEGKIGKLRKFLEEPVEVRMTLETERHRSIAELHVAHRLGMLQAEDESDDMFDAVIQVVDKAEKQARRARKKLIDKRRRADRHSHDGFRWPVEVLERNSVGGGSSPRIIKSSHLRIKPMSIEEAALELGGSKNDFVVFRDATTDRVNVLYRRKDENYGLITPEI